jgi:GDPmannose 4,6-dehydratase
VRRSSSFNRGRIEHLYDHENKGQLKLHYGDITDFSCIVNIFNTVKPDEIYNLAAQSHVAVSFENPIYTGQVDAMGVLNVLEAARIACPTAKIYQASTSELFSGDPAQIPQNELTPFNPKSPYGVAKLYGFNIARVYRESYKMFVCNGILFNHEGERRGENFVTRKITLGLNDILKGKAKKIKLGNLRAQRDWGYAPDYVEAMWLMLQQEEADDYVIATGQSHSVRDFVKLAFELRGLNYKDYVEVDERLIRPNEVNVLCGDATKAMRKLGWSPKTTFEELVTKMVNADCK